MLDNTLIVVSSDNAASALFATGARSPEEREESGGGGLEEKPPASNGELRGGKGSLHEGGVRVPTIFYWPAKLRPGFLGAQGKTIFDPDFDIDDGGLPHERPAIPGL